MNRTRHSPGRSSFRFTRWLYRIIDGERVWGSVEAWPGRHGLRRYRLVVFPPGITATERRRLRLWRARPLRIPVVYLGAEIFFLHKVTRWQMIAASTIVCLATGASCAALAGHLRSQVRTLSSAQLDRHPDRDAKYTDFEMQVRALVKADASHSLGRLSPVDHEAVWWRVYDALDQGTESASAKH